MAHPHKHHHRETEKRAIDRLDLPDAGAVSGEGRLQKLNLHDQEGGNPPAEPTGMMGDEAAAGAAEDEQE